MEGGVNRDFEMAAFGGVDGVWFGETHHDL